MTSLQHLFLIDECLPPLLKTVYLDPHLGLSATKAKVEHFVEKFGRNGRWTDPKWVPFIARDPKWVVISADFGSKSTKLECIRCLCRTHKVRLIWLTNAVKERSLEFYGPQILGHWQRVLQVAAGPCGTQSRFRMSSDGSRAQFDVVECPAGYAFEKGQFVHC